MRFRVENMNCGGCARSVTKVILGVDADAHVVANPTDRLVEIRSGQAAHSFSAALADAGFPAVAA